ncbi:MAG TPA: hypothetical protein VF074_17850 [Pyrinomonadaceae bacterium]
MPTVAAGHAGRVQVRSLMTLRAVCPARCLATRSLVAGRASQPGNAMAIRPSHHIELVTPPVVALLRVVGGSVTIDAARMNKN